MAEPLSAPYVLEYPYSRSTGPVIGRFLTSLRDGKIEGVRAKDGRVICPPLEYDEQGAPTADFVEVGPGGEVVAFTWVAKPRAAHPFDRPFAWALVRLDGASTAMLHAVDAGSPERMKQGLRVRARFAKERKGFITDIECFELESAGVAAERPGTPAPAKGGAK
jgi:uncharacterized protein